MLQWIIYAMVYLGSALMVYNIVGFVRFARFIKGMKMWSWGNRILHLPIFLLVSFLLGYLAIGLFGKPDILVAGILFGGSVFVFVMYKLFSVTLQRVVEMERVEAELLAAEQSSRAKSSFLASVSHEMRTPMNVILGQYTLALRNPELSPQTREQMEKIGQSAKRLSELINGILEMQQIESGELTIHSEVFSLKDVLEQVGETVSARCAAKGLAYQTEFDDCASLDYTGDAQRLRQVLLCLLDNAVKFTDAPGAVRFAVTCPEAEAERCAIRFVISDTGVGIDEAFLLKIMEPFAQEDASFTNRFGGSGMGLSVANSIVTRMGGAIEATSRKGEGSTFTVTLPLAPVASVKSACGEDGDCAGGEADAPVTLAGRRVLIVEDMAENAEIVTDLLELEDVQCDWAENGQKAVDMVSRSEPGHYDAILMDLRMPVMDGLEATRRIRALDREDAGTVPIIALTANGTEIDIQNSREAGMNYHLVKPVDADKMYATLKRWIERTQRERSA